MEKRNKFPELRPIAKSEMNFVSVSWGNYVFLDTMNFFKGKLEELWHVVANHEEKKDSKGHSYWDTKNENLEVFETTNEILTQQYPDVDWKKAMRGKGKIPYSWLTKERMKHSFLPPLEEWIDELYGEGISLEDLKRYNQIFKDYNCKDVEEYCDLYLNE